MIGNETLRYIISQHSPPSLNMALLTEEKEV